MAGAPKLDAGHAGCRDVLKIAAERVGWQIVLHSGCSVAWVDQGRDAEVRLAARRAKGEWVSWIPGVPELCGKIALAATLQDRGSAFWPRTWNAPPIDAEMIAKEVFADGASATLIVKPDEGSQGTGIGIAQSRPALSRLVATASPAIVQEYIAQPLLLDDRKWDCRIYVLMMPLPDGGHVSFLAREGLVRVCLERYEQPAAANLSKTSVHLTNYSLNKFSESFEHSDDPADATSGCKRLMSAVLQRLEAEPGPIASAALTWQVLGELSHEIVDAISEQLAGSESVLGNCFHVLGLDVLFDVTGRPWLLEANYRPSLLVDELHAVPGASRLSQAELNRLMAANKAKGSGDKWGKPCRCSLHPILHEHHLSAVDVACKSPVVEGALLIAHRARGGGDVAKWADGTIYQLV